MKRIPIYSRHIISVGYGVFNILEIKFSSGETYQYHQVPETVYLELINASSKSTYFKKNINLKFSCSKIF